MAKPRVVESTNPTHRNTGSLRVGGIRKHFHPSKRKRSPTQSDTSQTATLPVATVLGCPICTEAYRAAKLFGGFPDTFKFCDNPAFLANDVANFVIGALRNRARALPTPIRVAEFVNRYFIFLLSVWALFQLVEKNRY